MVSLIGFILDIFNKLSIKEVIIVIFLSILIKKILLLYIIINSMIPFRLIYVIFSKKMYTSNIVDCAIIKIIAALTKSKKKYEKIDNLVFFYIAYICILFFPFSPKSISIAKTLYKEILYYVFISKKNIFKILKRTIEKEFLLKGKELGVVIIWKKIIEIDPDIQ